MSVVATVTEAVLFVAAGSGVVDDSVAVLLIEPMTPEARATTMVTGTGVADTGNTPECTQVTVVVPEHNQPTEDVDEYVSPAGSTSEMVTLAAWDGPALTTLKVYVEFARPAVKVPPETLASERSAEAVTAVASLMVLFSDNGSLVNEATTKMALVVASGASAATTVSSTSGDDAPAAMSDGLVQVTEPVPTHVQPRELVPVEVIPTGSVAVTVMKPAASDVPALATLMLYASAVPVTTGAACEAVMETSAEVTEEDVSVAVLLAGTESGVPDDTDAALLTVLGRREADTFTMTSTDDVELAAMVGPVQVTVVMPVQVHEPALAEANVMPAGRTSVRVMGPTASDGAWLVTASV